MCYNAVREIPIPDCMEVVNMPAKAPDINMDNAIEAYLAGEPAQKVAPRFGVCGKRLTKILKERGLLRTKKQSFALTPHLSSLESHHALGLDDAEISRRYLAGESEKAL